MKMVSEITQSQLSFIEMQVRGDDDYSSRAANSIAVQRTSFADDTALSQQASQASFSNHTFANMLNMRPVFNGPKRILDEEEWETLRPVIQLHYIDKNKTFVQVARILKQTNGFEPT
jgi:hypothetical protein